MQSTYYRIKFCLIFTGVSYSQIVSDYGMKIGITASKINYVFDPSINVTDIPFAETRISPNIGIFLRFFDFKKIDFETQLSYLQKGGENKFELYLYGGGSSNKY